MTPNSPLKYKLSWHWIFLLFLFLEISPAMGLSASPVELAHQIQLRAIISGNLHKPVFLTHANEEGGHLYLVEQNGRILIIKDEHILPRPFLDITAKLSLGGERGLLGLAFHPQYSKNGRFFVNYTRKQDRATVIAEYQRSDNPMLSSPDEKVLLVIPQPYGNHNGGMLAFGPDKFLYIGMGDGGSGGDPENYGQNPQALLGKMLRLDVDSGTPYGVPSDNPYANNHEKGKPEIFASGLRNPWRFSFDRENGALWAGDVGQNDWEEIAIIKKGENHGWRIMEGSHCFNPKSHCQSSQHLTLPVFDYEHTKGRCSVTGGYVYRGMKMPKLQGTYIFGDFCSGEIWGYRDESAILLADTNLQISSFGEDADGEMYVLGYSGSIHELLPVKTSGGSQQ